MILVDTSGLLAALDGNDPLHVPCLRSLRASRGPRLLSPFVLAELDYMIGKHAGPAAQRGLLAEVADGAYRVEPFGREDVAAAMEVLDRYADLRIGLADASLVVIARRHGIRDLLTLDERHFRVVLGPDDRPFRLLPADVGF